MTVIQIRRFIRKDSHADIIITNHSGNCEEISERLRKTGFFNSVFYVRDRGDIPNGLLRRSLYYAPFVLNKSKKLDEMVQLNEEYDEVWFYNAIMLTQLICHRFRNASFYRFEEGYGTYTKNFIEKKSVRFFYRVLFGNLENKIKGLYLFRTDLFKRKVNCKIYEIPRFSKSDEELVDILNYVFKYNKDETTIDKEYIFFEESFFVTCEDIDDYSTVEKLIDLIGTESLAIKRHPRVLDNRFEKYNIDTMDAVQDIPWEVIELNSIRNNHQLITISSGSVLASALYFDDDRKVYLLYKCLKRQPKTINEFFLQYIDNIIRKSKSVIVVNDINEVKVDEY